MDKTSSWSEVQKEIAIGSFIEGVVVNHKHFGIFIKFESIDFLGLIPITHVLDSEQCTIKKFPKLGSSIVGKALGFTNDQRQQIWISIKPSDLIEQKDVIHL